MASMDKPRHTAADEGKVSRPSLYASQVTVYPKAVHGPVRRVKWALLPTACPPMAEPARSPLGRRSR